MIASSVGVGERNMPRAESEDGSLSKVLVKGATGICIIFSPWFCTGNISKWNVMVASPFDKAKTVCRRSVNSEIARIDGIRIGRVAQVDNEVRRLSGSTLPQAGSAVVTAKPTRSLSVKASCCGQAVMAHDRPSMKLHVSSALAEPSSKSPALQRDDVRCRPLVHGRGLTTSENISSGNQLTPLSVDLRDHIL